VDAVIVGGLLVSVAGGADGLGRSWIVRDSSDVGVAIGATERAVNRRLELRVIDMQADLFAVLVFRETVIVMASQAVLIAHLGGGFGQSNRREQQGNRENQTATLHETPRFRPRNRCTGQHSTMTDKGAKGQ